MLLLLLRWPNTDLCELGSIYLIARNLHGSSTRKKGFFVQLQLYVRYFYSKKKYAWSWGLPKKTLKINRLFLENLVHFWPEVIQSASVRSQFSVNSKAAFAMETASTLQKMPKYYTLHGNTCTFYWNCFIMCVS